LLSVGVVVAVVAAVVSALAGAAFIVSGVAGAGVAVTVLVVEVAAESALEEVPLVLLPQEVTNRPKVKASRLNFTNFIISFFRWLCRFIPQREKGNLPK
jgi:hypothetical protein